MEPCFTKVAVLLGHRVTQDLLKQCTLQGIRLWRDVCVGGWCVCVWVGVRARVCDKGGCVDDLGSAQTVYSSGDSTVEGCVCKGIVCVCVCRESVWVGSEWV